MLEKSQTPANKVKKELALEVIINALCNETGKKYAAKTMSKKIAFVKSRLKMKSDINRTGNKQIKLNDSEKKLLHLMDVDRNPIFNKIEGKLIDITICNLLFFYSIVSNFRSQNFWTAFIQ